MRISFNCCVSMLRDVPRVASHGNASRVESLGHVVQCYVQYLRASGSRSEACKPSKQPWVPACKNS